MSRHDFLLPDLGDGMAEAELMTWLVAEGAPVTEHQPIAEVQTDKAVVELPSPVTGILVAHGAAAGGMIKLHGLVAAFEVPDNRPTSGTAAPAPGRPEVVATLQPTAPGSSAAHPAGAVQAKEPAASNARRPLAAPAVRQLARTLGVDLAGVAGSGPGGRVLREDVQAAAAPGTPAHFATDVIASAPQSFDGTPPAAADLSQVEEREAASTRTPLRGLRRAVARRMTETLRTVPHVTGLIEIDITKLEKLLQDLRPAAEAEDVRLTWTAFFALATVQALREFPQLNASLDLEREEIVQHRHIHLGIATATAEGLLVPVVRDADSLSLLELAAEIARVSGAARERTATAAELTGSTFTLTNYGSVGGWYGTPMVNAPEIGIVGFGSVAQRPAVVDGELAVRTMVALSHTVDHRLIDGAVNASFGAAIRRRLEEPRLLLLGARRGHG